MTQDPAEIEREAEPADQQEEARVRPLNDVANLRRQVIAREHVSRGQLPRGRR